MNATKLPDLLTPRLTRYITRQPTPRQAAFLLLDHVPEVLYGGAAGGGKSEALIMAALQYVDVPGYAALLLRRSYADLALPQAIMARTSELLSGTDAYWHDKTKTWIFPSGATLTFGYLASERHKYRYQSAEFQFIGMDELTQFTRSQYLYMWSRLRRKRLSAFVPLRMRAGSNPGNIGHAWVKERFIDAPPSAERLFVPARLRDNPHVDAATYIQSLSNLDPITRAQYLDGNWSVSADSGLFRRAWFSIVEPHEVGPLADVVRFWDCAGTPISASAPDPDRSVGLKLGRTADGRYYVLDVIRVDATPHQVDRLILQTARIDGPGCRILEEQEPGSSGKAVVARRARDLAGYAYRGVAASGDKLTRARPASALAEAGLLSLVRGAWNVAFLDELTIFPQGAHDDQVDALSGALHALTHDIIRSETKSGLR
jgi:predicted phage terminase large subunit-like protein